MVRGNGVDIFVELDVGSEYNSNDEQIRSVLYSVVKEGAIASYITSVQGFQFRRLGEGKMSAPCMLYTASYRHINFTEGLGSAINICLYFVAQPPPSVEPLAVPGLYYTMLAAWC